ncbi:MAG: hypothetical protein COB93_00335 [Sneathiella sp.]|nr:MAG: hypothetical protein COB93_00335 [Sneathiella sp.]
MMFEIKGKSLVRKGLIYLLLICAPAFIGIPQADENTVILRTAAEDLTITVELVDTAAERRKGLMFRESLPTMHGMLFDFNRTVPVTMWMKNTKISLDILFIDDAGDVRFIKHSAKPGSTETISPPKPVRAVLELAGGFARAHGVEIGDRLLHPLFDGY